MFEQSLYEQHVPAQPLQDGDLFHNYEIKSWKMSGRVYKILAFSAIGNLLALLFVAQTPVLTMKGCDSPLVGSVCQVLDTIYVGSKLLGTDRDYVDAEYNDEKLKDDEDIVWVDMTGVDNEPLDYPAGYFQIANPEQNVVPVGSSVDDLAFNPTATNPTTTPGEIAPGIPATGGTSLFDTAPNYPKPQKNIVTGPLPTFGGSNPVPNIPMKARKANRPGRIRIPTSPNENPGDGQTVASNPTVTPSPTPQPQPTITSDAVDAVVINKLPLTDFADKVATQVDTKEIDLNQPFIIVVNGFITKEGKLDKTKSKYDTSKQKGDPKMIDTAKLAVEAVGESGFLSYLRNLDVEKATLTFVQDNDQIVAIISGDEKTPEMAKTISSGLNALLVGARMRYSDVNADERKLLDGATVGVQGNNFVLNFKIPKPIAQEMINRRIKEAQAKKAQQQKPNGTTVSKQNTNVGGN